MTQRDDPISVDQARALRLVVVHQPLIQAYARVICGDPAMADDAAQEVALDIVAKPERLPPPEAEVPWLKRVVRNKALLQMRQRKRQHHLPEEVLEQIGDAVTDAIDSLGAMREAMRGCLGRLGPEARRLVEARYGEGADCGTIAQRFGQRAQAIYSRLKRVRETLRRCVEQRLAEEARG